MIKYFELLNPHSSLSPRIVRSPVYLMANTLDIGHIVIHGNLIPTILAEMTDGLSSHSIF